MRLRRGVCWIVFLVVEERLVLRRLAEVSCIIGGVPGEGIGMGTGRRHGDANTPYAVSDLGADFDDFQGYGAGCGSGEVG